MKYLLDTHALLWYLFDDKNLSSTAKEIITNEFCYYSKISLWEIAIKQTRKLLEYKQSISEIIKACKDEEFDELFVSGNSLELIKTLPDIHRDPFDRLLIAMSMENNLAIITKDSKIPLYNVKTIW
ncbi:MAG: type II toxin-antitoxin system VapC family toxin [Treponema sp.]|nr:type II toxin-antitoxin system VapC family toxin [Treponema sp.]